MSEETRLCPHCGKRFPLSEAAFCPFCGSPLTAAQETPPEIRALLEQYKALTDPKKKLAFLEEKLSAHPDSLELNEERLFLGRLAERNPRSLDFSVIKCHLLQMYLSPETFSEEQRSAMREELLAHPHLKSCLALAPDREQFLNHYARRLSAEFIYLFLEGSSTYNRSFLGFRFGGRPEKVLSRPGAEIMANIRRDADLPETERERFYRAFRQAFRLQTGSTESLDDLLRGAGLPVPEA